jgi:hypothetical protein
VAEDQSRSGFCSDCDRCLNRGKLHRSVDFVLTGRQCSLRMEGKTNRGGRRRRLSSFSRERPRHENTWRGAREAESNALEMRRTARYRGFKSHPLRQSNTKATPAKNKASIENNNAPSQNGRGIVFDRINRCSRTVRNRSEKKPQANRKGSPPPKNYRRNIATMVRSQNEANAFHSPRWVPTHEVIDVVKAPSKALAAAEESSTRYKPRAKPCS